MIEEQAKDGHKCREENLELVDNPTVLADLEYECKVCGMTWWRSHDNLVHIDKLYLPMI